jgi:hypothetical protein
MGRETPCFARLIWSFAESNTDLTSANLRPWRIECKTPPVACSAVAPVDRFCARIRRVCSGTIQKTAAQRPLFGGGLGAGGAFFG